MKHAFALPALALLAACATTQGAPMVDNAPPAPGGLVAHGKSVQVGMLVATPVQVIEDSRCPQDARCIQAGRLIVSTRIDGAGWHKIAALTLGEPRGLHGTTITLVSGVPEKSAERATPMSAYRFAFAGGE